MTRLSSLVTLCLALEATPGRLDKLRLVTDFLSALGVDEAAGAVAYLTGRAFPASDPRVLGARDLPPAGPAAVSSLTLADVDEAFAAVAAATGAGSRRMREDRLTALAARATSPEQAWLRRTIGGEVQRSASYPSGFALRFARITRVRDDKPPPQATSLDELGRLYERQFAAKGRSAE